MDYKDVLKILKTQNVFLTGSAGTGKTYLTKKLIENSKDDIIITASTGLASLNIGGSTIHSALQLGINEKPELAYQKTQTFNFENYVVPKVKKCKLLIIDEISMISNKLLEVINITLQSIFWNDLPFGGLRVLLVGDFLQLPPVQNDWAFKSSVWDDLNLKVVQLKENKRQEEDQYYFNILNDIRVGKFSKDLFESVKARKVTGDYKISKEITNLVATNAEARLINNVFLRDIDSQIYTFEASVWGENSFLVKSITDNCIAEEKLILKVGANVINLVNNGSVVNGMKGIIERIEDRQVYVFFSDIEDTIKISEATWEKKDSKDSKIVAKFTQLPLKLSYALTVHKAQGMSLDEVYIDCERFFAKGQFYVALSRVKRLETLYLANLSSRAFKWDESALNFYKDMV